MLFPEKNAKKERNNAMNPETCTVKKLTAAQMEELRSLLTEKGWTLNDAPYCLFKTAGEKVSIAAYTSGKLVIQGKGTGEFLEFLLEPYILKEAAFADMEARLRAEAEADAPFLPHAGIDESGKGDFFGALVIACAFVKDGTTAEKLQEIGVRDSKAIKSDARIRQIANRITEILDGKYALVAIGPEAYNRAYAKIGSLNRLLAWGHARALENLLAKAPECTDALADKFGDERLIQNALMECGRKITLRQQTKAESDIAVAAASILARAEFVRRMDELGKTAGITLPKGAGGKVDEAAAEVVRNGGKNLLRSVAKMHFRNAEKALGEG